MVKRWEAIVQADDAEQFATFKKRIEQFVEFRKELVRRANEISPAAGREWGDNDANRSVRSALNKDLEALSKVYAERGKQHRRADRDQPQLSFVLTCLGGVALLLVVIGVIIIARSIARPLSRHHRDHQAGRRRRRKCRGAAHRPRRRDRRAGARDPDLPGGDGAQPQSQLAGLERIPRRAQERSRHIEASVEEFREAIGAVLNAVTENASAMRKTAQTITRVTSDASERADGRDRRDHAGLRQRLRGRGRGRRTVGLGRRRSAARSASPPSAVEQTGQRTEKSISEIESLAAATQRIDGVLTADPGDRRADQPAGAERHHRGRARRRCRPRLCRGRA